MRSHAVSELFNIWAVTVCWFFILYKFNDISRGFNFSCDKETWLLTTSSSFQMGYFLFSSLAG